LSQQRPEFRHGGSGKRPAKEILEKDFGPGYARKAHSSPVEKMYQDLELTQAPKKRNTLRRDIGYGLVIGACVALVGLAAIYTVPETLGAPMNALSRTRAAPSRTAVNFKVVLKFLLCCFSLNKTNTEIVMTTPSSAG